MAAPQASSRLEMLQARFQQRQLLEKEQKLLQLYDQQQLRAHQVAQRGSAGSNASNSSGNGTNSTMSHQQTVTRSSTQSTSNLQGGGKVRQMFDERRQTTVKGIDKSYPLEPLDNRSRKQQIATSSTTSNIVVSSSSPIKNGNPSNNRQNLVTRRTVRSETNSNVNGGKPIVSYHEEITRESCGPSGHDIDHEQEFGAEDNLEPRYSNGNRQIEQHSEIDTEDVTNDNRTQRHRTTAKIHLTEFERSNGSHRVGGDNLENEQFPDDLAIDALDRLPRRGQAIKKPSQAETRLERFRNARTNRPSQTSKQVAGNTTSFTKKRTETNVHSGSSSRASTVTKTREERFSRASSATPEFDQSERPRSLSPEVVEKEIKVTCTVDRVSSVPKTSSPSSAISKVGQLSNKNSMDYYPRRKSEFEKSRTFRKLQLELGESSPEPNDPEEVSSVGYTKQCKKRSSILESNIYSPGHRSSSSSPTVEHEIYKGQKNNREMSPERSKSRMGSNSPISRRESTRKNEETRTTSAGTKTISRGSGIYSFERRSSSASPTTDRKTYEERKSSREKSPEFSKSPRGSESSVYRRQTKVKSEETKKTKSAGSRTISRRSNIYHTERRSSSSSPITDRKTFGETKGRRDSREKSPERPKSRRGSESPSYRRETSSIVRNINRESNFYSSGRRSSSASPIPDHEAFGRRRNSHEKSPERPKSRRGSESPTYRKKSTITTDVSKKRNSGTQITGKETRVTSEGTKIRNESSTFGRHTKKRSESPRRNVRPSSIDREYSDDINTKRKNSGGNLRSFELVQKLVRSSSQESKTAPSARESFERKTLLEDVEFSVDSSNRSKTPEHKIVKKDKAVLELAKDDKLKTKAGVRNNRSRTVSPVTPLSSTMKETASFRAKKNKRKNSMEVKKNEINKQRQAQKINEDNTINRERSRKSESSYENRSSSPDEDRKERSRKSSSEITVRRHDTFKVTKPSQGILKIGTLSGEQKINADVKDKSQLLERIEKIRSTLSMSGKSEQNLQSKDFERTDSVESALRRFDSIGTETEHQIIVGVDELDHSSPCRSPEPVINVPFKESAKLEQIVSKKSTNSERDISVAVVKAQPRKIDYKNRIPAKDKISRVNLKQKLGDASKSSKAKNEKLIITKTPRQSDNKMGGKPKRSNQKIATSLVRKSKLMQEEPSGRGEGKSGIRSPICKRRLFDDSEFEIETDNSKSTVVLSTITRVTKGPHLIEIETTNNRKNLNKSCENLVASESSFRESKTEYDQPTKVLRSIEDIRKSIKRESQDFKRELNKFNTVMQRDEENTKFSPATTTSGIVSCVQITKTLKPGTKVPEVKIERSTVKLPITHRVAKSPSPDIGVKRSTDVRSRTPTSGTGRSAPSSPAKSPDSSAGGPGIKILAKTSTSPSAIREERHHRLEASRTTEYSDSIDGPAYNDEFGGNESVGSISTKRNDAFTIELDDDDVPEAKEIALSSQGKPPLRKQSTEKSLTSQKQQRSPTNTPLPRPSSSMSTASSGGSVRIQNSQVNSKSRVATKAKSPTASTPKGQPGSARVGSGSAANDGLAACKICGRRFNSDRVTLHEQICAKTGTKKRKQFDAAIHRVKGTELEPFVKKVVSKKPQVERKAQKAEVKSNWRKKHEDFINAIRSAKQVQAHLAAGGKLSDLPPPPASDTSDYVQCPHCGRKFNQAAADRHIPKCQNMLHNKPNPRVPPKSKR